MSQNQFFYYTNLDNIVATPLFVNLVIYSFPNVGYYPPYRGDRARRNDETQHLARPTIIPGSCYYC